MMNALKPKYMHVYAHACIHAHAYTSSSTSKMPGRNSAILLPPSQSIPRFGNPSNAPSCRSVILLPFSTSTCLFDAWYCDSTALHTVLSALPYSDVARALESPELWHSRQPAVHEIHRAIGRPRAIIVMHEVTAEKRSWIDGSYTHAPVSTCACIPAGEPSLVGCSIAAFVK